MSHKQSVPYCQTHGFKYAKRLILYGLMALFLVPHAVRAQQNSANPDTLATPTFKGAFLRSALVPGWGQIYQERLLPAAALYATSAVFTYRSLFHLYHYQKSRAENHKKLLYTNLEVTAALYTLNLLDVTYAALYKHPEGWQGGLLDDRPLKSPWGAVLRSAILPGWGQIYTANYWKAAAYFAVNGFFVYQIRKYDVAFQRSHATADRDQRSRFSWYFGLSYLITLADAYADAYLYKFDEAMRMTILPVANDRYVLLNLKLRF